jgi:NADH-quinone oxidoreductase subunit H
MPLFAMFIVFFICVLVEINRYPFDLPEAESELVSGYNVEYAAAGFALFFLAEYSNMIVMCILTAIFFLGG